MKKEYSGRGENPHRYDDLLDLENPTSRKHPRMSPLNRAAQFSPFAALTGYEGQIREAQQFRCSRVLLSEEEQAPIHAVLAELKKHDSVKVRYFMEDPGTDGSGGMAEGVYRDLEGEVLRIEPAGQILRIGGEDWWEEMQFEDILSLRVISMSKKFES